MNTLYKRYRSDPTFREALVAAAHRERAAAIGRLIIRPLRALLAQRPRRASRMLHRSGAF